MTDRIDPLTGLPNEPALHDTLKRSLSALADVALAVLDLDSFAEINNDFGMEVGDRVLKVLAGALAEAAPAGAYHLSGDEFALVLPGLSLEQAFLRVEVLRGRIHNTPELFDLPDRRALSITLGVAQYPRDAKDVGGLLRAALAALQAAKEGGRNQVALPPNEEMVMKSCYYPSSSIRKLKALAERLGRKESPLLREALDDLFRKYDVPR